LQSTSSNWEKITLADHDKSLSGINRYGVLGGYSLFAPNNNLFSRSTNEAWIQFNRMGGINSPARNFDKIRIFYGYNSKPFMVQLDSDGKTNDAELIPNKNKLSTLSWDISQSTNTFEIRFKGDSSPLIFGISLETEKGIAVDNIPIRGSSGTDFTKTDMAFMKDMLSTLNAKLIILQFGVNVVPNVVESYKYYQNQLFNQIKALQSALPDVSIIMIGVSDVSRKEGLNYTSYPNIEKIRDAQKQAAFKAGIPFWDCYKAMGGKNSMAAWENAKPPLATKDFIHFTYRGANLIAEMFYAALISDYEKYLERRIKPASNKVVSIIDSTNISKSKN
jgi:lysophospholipase L1-like esterase